MRLLRALLALFRPSPRYCGDTNARYELNKLDVAARIARPLN